MEVLVSSSADEYNELKFLYREFCNHIYLGQWELVRAFALTILKCNGSDESIAYSLKQTLRNLSESPFLVRNTWSKFPSSSYPSFLSSQLLEQICLKEEKVEAECLLQNTRFCILLEECFPKLECQLLKELSSLYSAISRNTTKNDSSDLYLSEETSKFLRTGLLQDTSVISLLLQELSLCKNFHSCTKLKNSVFSLIVSALHHCLKQVELHFRRNEKCDEWISKCHLILHLLPNFFVTLRRGKDYEDVDRVFALIISLCKNDVLQSEKVLSSLVSGQSCELLHYYCAKETEFTYDNTHSDFKCALKIENFNLPEAALWSLLQSSHFVECILDLCVRRILTGDFCALQKDLSQSVLSRLLPLALILSWNGYKDEGAFSNIVQATKLWQPTDEDDIFLVKVCNKFLTNISFKESCIEYYVQHHPDADPRDITIVSNHIFEQLQTHSPLAVLQRVFSLKSMDANSVFELLSCFSKDNTDIMVPSVDLITLAASRDTIIYHGYLSVMLAMEAILYSCEIINLMDKNGFKQSQVMMKPTPRFGFDGIECVESSYPKNGSIAWQVKEYVQNRGIQSAYGKFVSERLQTMKQELKRLYPLTYRVEILENIFSLLFLSSKDFQECPFDYSGSDEGHEGEYSNSSVRDSSVKSEKDDADGHVLPFVRFSKSKANIAIVKSVPLKQVPKIRTETADFCSGHGSSQSTGSSGSSGIMASGFLCNELIISDILLLLKDAILEVDAEIYKARSDLFNSSDKCDSSEINPNKQRMDPKTSINSESIQKHTSQLRQYIEEAHWRYNLVKSNSFKGAPTLESSVKAASSSSKQNLLPNFYFRMTSSDNAESSEGSVQRRRKKKKRKLLSKQCFQSKVPLLGSGIIHYMLSPPDALLRYCLWRQNTEEALEVIKLCSLQFSPEAKELMFSKQINQLCDKMTRVSKTHEKSDKLNTTEKDPKGRMNNIVAIANAAMSGLQSTFMYSVVEQEVNQWDIPPIREVLDVMDYIAPAEKSLLDGADNSISISLSDIACTRHLSVNQCIVLLEMALLHWTHQDVVNTSSAQKKSFSFIPGNFKMTQTLLDLIKSFLTFFHDSDKNGLIKIFFPRLESQTTFPDSLVSYIGPFSSSQFNNFVEAWRIFSDHVVEVGNLLKEGEEEHSDSCVNPKNKLHVAYKNLFHVMKNLSNWSTEGIRPHPSKYKNYLKKLFVYLQQVTGALLGCKDQNVPAGMTSYTSYFSALKESPTTILKTMIDQNKISQQKIEKFAMGMKVDLGQVLIQTFFPPVPLSREKKLCYSPSQKRQTDISGVAYVVLNQTEEPWVSPRHPDLAARELLRDLISMSQDVAMAKDSGSIQTMPALLSLSQHSEMTSWMNDCCEIAFVDLDLLQSPEEVKAFFINVTNLAWMHALLFQLTQLNLEPSSEVFCDSRQFTLDTGSSLKKSNYNIPPISSSFLAERVMQQKTIGYAIGQLGIVSLFDLRFNILHSNFPIPKHLDMPPFKDFFIHERDLPSLWVHHAPKADPREIFVLCEGLLYSPKLQALYSETLSEQLDDAMRDYLNFNITVDLEHKTVCLPELLDLYSLDFDEGRESNTSPYEGLLTFLSDFMNPMIAKPLDQLLSLRPNQGSSTQTGDTVRKQLLFEVKVQPLAKYPGFKLDYVSTDHQEISVSSCMSVPEPKILSYLKTQCPLITYLYQLMTSNEDTLTEKYPITHFLKQQWDMTCSDPKETKLKSLNKLDWFVSSLSPAPSSDFILREIQTCFHMQKWEIALKYIDVFLEFHDPQFSPSFCLLRQIILMTLAGAHPKNDDSPWAWAISIADPVSRAKTVLQHIHKWEKEIAINTLKYCLSETEDHCLMAALRVKLKEIVVYQKILEASMNLESEEANVNSEAFANWQDIAEKSVWDQPSILQCIKSSGNYELAVEWLQLHDVNSSLKLMAWSMQIVWCLKQEPPQFDEVLKILEACTDSAECVELIEQTLPEISTITNKLYLVQYLVGLGLDYTNQCHYLNISLGLRILHAARGSIDVSHYYHLVSMPHLLLEQMLMNLEVNGLEKAIKAVYNDLDAEEYRGVSMSPLSINQLLETYASKALELSLSDDLTDSNTTILDSEEINFSVELFVMPANIPFKEHWIPDSRVHICQCCKQEQFNMFSRRHHCRRCGRVICSDCSQNVLVLEGLGKSGVRVCDDCYSQTMCCTVSGKMTPPFRSLSLDKRYRMLSSIKSAGQRSSPLLSDYYVVKRRASSIANSEIACWTLSDSDEHNSTVRAEFFYDSAPSVSLSLSILKLHSNIGQCAKFMLTLCDQLINKLRPKASGKTNSEVDFYLVIGMIQTFLVNSKVKYHQILDHESAALVDDYFERLEIIKILVKAHCTHLIPKDDVPNSKTVRKLCDRALEEERMTLALEISTNFGLDKHGVWSSWGMFCLRAGDWPAARDKFKQCLKVVKDRNKSSRESPTLQNIVTYLEKREYPGHGKGAAIYKTLALRDEILKGNTKISREVSPIDERVKEECLYYLNTYGSHFSTVAFFQRQALISDALLYILNEKCEPETFVEALFMPALMSSQLSLLLQHLSSTDPNLTKWWSYLLSTCRYLQRTGYHNVLYQLQLFMEDYIRAAKSSIAFYLSGAASYSTIYFERNHHLHNAKKHFELYLLKSRTPSLVQNRNVLILPDKEVKSYLRTIELQEELAKFFKLCQPENLKSLEYRSEGHSSSISVATLFSSWSKKLELASLVAVNAVKIDEGFDLCTNIVKEYRLNPLSVACTAGRELIRLQWIDHLPHFLQNIRCSFPENLDIDDVILECLSAMFQQGNDTDFLIKMLQSDIKKINAFLICSKLKNAFLLAIKLQRPQDVRRIMKAAEQTGQEAVKKICEKWLITNAQKLAS